MFSFQFEPVHSTITEAHIKMFISSSFPHKKQFVDAMFVFYLSGVTKSVICLLDSLVLCGCNHAKVCCYMVCTNFLCCHLLIYAEICIVFNCVGGFEGCLQNYNSVL